MWNCGFKCQISNCSKIIRAIVCLTLLEYLSKNTIEGALLNITPYELKLIVLFAELEMRFELANLNELFNTLHQVCDCDARAAIATELTLSQTADL